MMNSIKNRSLFGIALLSAVLLGFGMARFLDEPQHPLFDSEVEHEGHSHDDDHENEGIVTLTARQITASGITIVAVGRGGGEEARLAGRVETARDARATIAAAVGGSVERVEVAPGALVEAGQILAVLVSGDAATLRAQADMAIAEAEAARLVYQRDLNLVEQGIVARQELEMSRARSLAADAAVRATQAQVVAVGSPDAAGRVPIVSPMAGTVGLIGVAPGGFVLAGDVIAEVSDPARTELVFTASPMLASWARVGTLVSVTGPAGSLEAVVTGVAPGVNERTGAAIVRARSVVGMLPPVGSPVTAIIITDRQDDGLTVPADAVHTVDGQAVVFVVIDEGFRATPVLTGGRAGGQIEILSGLSGSEYIAGDNAFLLKAELAKGEAEHVH